MHFNKRSTWFCFFFFLFLFFTFNFMGILPYQLSFFCRKTLYGIPWHCWHFGVNNCGWSLSCALPSGSNPRSLIIHLMPVVPPAVWPPKHLQILPDYTPHSSLWLLIPVSHMWTKHAVICFPLRCSGCVWVLDGINTYVLKSPSDIWCTSYWKRLW